MELASEGASLPANPDWEAYGKQGRLETVVAPQNSRFWAALTLV
jgi:hypothetical protein